MLGCKYCSDEQYLPRKVPVRPAAVPDDVFDLAELCYGLSQQGWSGEQIAKELGWSEGAVFNYKAIKDYLHPRAWSLARLTNFNSFVSEDDDGLVSPKLTKVSWRETHFRALLKHLLNGKI